MKTVKAQFGKDFKVAVKVAKNEWYCGKIKVVKKDGTFVVLFNDGVKEVLPKSKLKPITKTGGKAAYTDESIKPLLFVKPVKEPAVKKDVKPAVKKVAQPTAPDDLKRIQAMVDSMSNLMSQLYVRFQDEKDYEDINDYAVPFKKKLPKGFSLVKMSKRPFGFVFNIGTDALYLAYATSKAIGWKRIKTK
jgi:hypothetical protein